MTYAFFNFNTYLGGGETLIVRLAEYLKKKNCNFKMFYRKGSYIEKDLKRININEEHKCPISSFVDYYYLNDDKREKLRSEICGYLVKDEEVCFVSLNSRELFTLVDIVKNKTNYRLAHLILHNQDNLYVCQSLWDKIVLKIKGKRQFSRKKQIAFNKELYNVVCEQSIVIPQSELQAELLRNEFNIKTEKEKAVPLPTCDFSKYNYSEKTDNNHKIIWIGRIVDFKLPSLFVILNFVSRHKDYLLTVIGDGEMEKVHSYMKKNKISQDNITFLGKVEYAKLGDVIKNHSIGYAMGTSIIEIGKYGLPVIMALGSPNFECYDKDICGGLYYHQSRGNVGDTLYYKKSGDPVVTIDEAIDEIEKDYAHASYLCYEALKSSFDIKSDCDLYMKWLAQSSSIKTEIQIPHASILRKKYYNLF